MVAAQHGDHRAFTDLVRLCQPDVYRLLAHQVGDGDLALDLTQETFLRAHTKLHTFRGDASFAGWLLRIARNLGVDALRSRNRRTKLTQQLFRRARIDTAGQTTQLDDTQTELAQALATLPGDYREAFVRVEVLGYKYREAAEVLGVNDNTVKGRVFRARKQLIVWFEEQS